MLYIIFGIYVLNFNLLNVFCINACPYFIFLLNTFPFDRNLKIITKLREQNKTP